jgi:hypothetical protein
MPNTQTHKLPPILLGFLPITPSLLLSRLFPDQHKGPLSGPGWLFCSCLLLVRSVVRDSQWIQAVRSVLLASKPRLNFCLPFPSVSYEIRNFGKPIVLLATYFNAGFFLLLLFDPHDEGDILLRNVG